MQTRKLSVKTINDLMLAGSLRAYFFIHAPIEVVNHAQEERGTS